MRTVTASLSQLGLSPGETVIVTLVDSVGNTCTTPGGYAYDHTHILSGESLTLSLKESASLSMLTSYRLELPNGTLLNFHVPSAPVGDDTPHDLVALLRSGCIGSVVDAGNGELDNDFLAKLDRYLAGEIVYFSELQQMIVDLYFYYADSVYGTGSTFDVMAQMDAYLATV